MHYVTFDFLGQHRHGPAFHEYLRLRKAFFVDDLGWDIPHNEDVEMDQYDNPTAHYVLVMRHGEVVGGARAMATSASWGQHTYMLRDALRGSLESIPPEVMPYEIANDEVWEGSRLVISNKLKNSSERSECLSLIFSGLGEIAARHGGSEVIGLTRPPLVRALRNLGFAASRLGEPYVSDDGRQYAVLHMPAATSAHLIAAE
jgi:N-acyl-L-homoserine lactone synthetase